MKTYISGPITGLPDNNSAAFETAEAYIIHRGDEPVNPLRITSNGTQWADYMRSDIRELVTCDGIVVLKGWQGSRGSCLEVQIARELGMAFTLLDA